VKPDGGYAIVGVRELKKSHAGKLKIELGSRPYS
jgi:hypothetical protein